MIFIQDLKTKYVQNFSEPYTCSLNAKYVWTITEPYIG